MTHLRTSQSFVQLLDDLIDMLLIVSCPCFGENFEPFEDQVEVLETFEVWLLFEVIVEGENWRLEYCYCIFLRISVFFFWGSVFLKDEMQFQQILQH